MAFIWVSTTSTYIVVLFGGGLDIRGLVFEYQSWQYSSNLVLSVQLKVTKVNFKTSANYEEGYSLHKQIKWQGQHHQGVRGHSLWRPWLLWSSRSRWAGQWTRWPAPQSWSHCLGCRVAPPGTETPQIWWSELTDPPGTAGCSKIGCLTRPTERSIEHVNYVRHPEIARKINVEFNLRKIIVVPTPHSSFS